MPGEHELTNDPQPSVVEHSRSGEFRRRDVLIAAAVGGGLAGGVAILPASPPAHSAPIEHPALGPVADLARWDENGYRRFRIPALTQTRSGTLLAVFDGRPDMGDLPTAGIDVLVRRSEDGGATWGPLQTIRTDETWSSGDPSLLVDHETGRIFCFYTAAVHAGYADSGTGNDPQDPNITQQDLSWSDDDGRTWTHRRITAEIKDPSWAGMFASSGEGIQLRSWPYAGRLLQQYVTRVDGANYAVTGYSDDHGETWRHGELVGPGADENKVSERSDGSVLLNSRTSGRRLQAVSEDGGISYSEFRTVPEQIDPGNNGAITRLFPDAAPDDPEASVQVLSHAFDPSIRRHVSLQVSFDDGETWTGRFLIDDGASAYSTITPLGDGRLGLLYEREGYSTISYRTMDVRAMAPSAVELSIPEGTSVPSGRTTNVTVTARNLGPRPVTDLTVTLRGNDDIEGTAVTRRAVPPGGSRAVNLPVQVPSSISGVRDVELTAEATTAWTAVSARRGITHAARSMELTIEHDPEAVDHPSLDVLPVIDAVYPKDASGQLEGNLAVPWARIRNSGNVPVTDIAVSSSAGGDGETIGTLDPGQTYTVTARTALGHTLTAADIAAGEFSPEVIAEGKSATGPVYATGTMHPLTLNDIG